MRSLRVSERAVLARGAGDGSGDAEETLPRALVVLAAGLGGAPLRFAITGFLVGRAPPLCLARGAGGEAAFGGKAPLRRARGAVGEAALVGSAPPLRRALTGEDLAGGAPPLRLARGAGGGGGEGDLAGGAPPLRLAVTFALAGKAPLRLAV